MLALRHGERRAGQPRPAALRVPAGDRPGRRPHGRSGRRPLGHVRRAPASPGRAPDRRLRQGRRRQPAGGPRHGLRRGAGRGRAPGPHHLRVRAAGRGLSRRRCTTWLSATSTAPRRCRGAACPAWYAGSPLALDFGEEADRKAVLVVEAEPGSPASVRQVPLESGRALRTLRGSFVDLRSMAEDVGDDWLRVEVDEPARAGLADEVRALLPNAVQVSARPVERGRGRSPGPTAGPVARRALRRVPGRTGRRRRAPARPLPGPARRAQRPGDRRCGLNACWSRASRRSGSRSRSTSTAPTSSLWLVRPVRASPASSTP